MLPIVSVMYAGGLLIIPGILTAACGWASLRWSQASITWNDLTCRFTLALVPVGFGMWLAHFSNHLVAGWSSLIPALERISSRASSAVYPQAWIPGWILSLELTFLGLGLLLTLYRTWRAAGRVARGDRSALAVMAPWAVLAGGLYSAGVWIVLQPMQMRGTISMIMR